MKKIYYFLAFVLVAALLAGCGGPVEPVEPDKDEKVELDVEPEKEDQEDLEQADEEDEEEQEEIANAKLLIENMTIMGIPVEECTIESVYEKCKSSENVSAFKDGGALNIDVDPFIITLREDGSLLMVNVNCTDPSRIANADGVFNMPGDALTKDGFLSYVNTFDTTIDLADTIKWPYDTSFYCAAWYNIDNMIAFNIDITRKSMEGVKPEGSNNTVADTSNENKKANLWLKVGEKNILGMSPEEIYQAFGGSIEGDANFYSISVNGENVRLTYSAYDSGSTCYVESDAASYNTSITIKSSPVIHQSGDGTETPAGYTYFYTYNGDLVSSKALTIDEGVAKQAERTTDEVRFGKYFVTGIKDPDNNYAIEIR